MIFAAAAVSIVSMFPPGPYAVFRQSPPKHIIEFNQPVVSHKVEVYDNDGCKINQDSSVEDQTRVVVTLRACDRTGFPSGVMTIKWTVNGESGKYELLLRHHH